MKIKLGRTYRMKSGHKTTIEMMETWKDGKTIFTDGDRLRWDADGKALGNMHHSDITEAEPLSLGSMTWDIWKELSGPEQNALRDFSDCNPQLNPLVGKKVQVEPGFGEAAKYPTDRFWVGRSMGWKPVLLVIRKKGQDGSGETIPKDFVFTKIEVLG